MAEDTEAHSSSNLQELDGILPTYRTGKSAVDRPTKTKRGECFGPKKTVPTKNRGGFCGGKKNKPGRRQ